MQRIVLRWPMLVAATAAALVSLGAEQQSAAQAAQRYTVPVGRPRGEIVVQSLGVQAVAGPWEIKVLHVRITIANDVDDTPWEFDTGEVTGTLEGQGTSQAAYVDSDAGAPPELTVPRGERRVVDFLFVVPSSLPKGAAPVASVSWSVRTGLGEVSRETSFGG